MPDYQFNINGKTKRIRAEKALSEAEIEDVFRSLGGSTTSTVVQPSPLSFGGEPTLLQQAAAKTRHKPTVEDVPLRAPKKGELDLRARPTDLQERDKYRQATAKPKKTLATKETTLSPKKKVKVAPNPYAPYMGTSSDPTIFSAAADKLSELLGSAFGKVDEMVARGALEAGLGTGEAQQNYRTMMEQNPYSGGTLGQQSFWQNLDPEMMRSANYGTDIGSQLVRFGLNMMTPSNALPIGGALGTVTKAPMASRALAGAFGLPAVQSGVQQMGQGNLIEGLLNTLTGGLGVKHALKPFTLPTPLPERQVAPTSAERLNPNLERMTQGDAPGERLPAMPQEGGIPPTPPTIVPEPVPAPQATPRPMPLPPETKAPTVETVARRGLPQPVEVPSQPLTAETILNPQGEANAALQGQQIESAATPDVRIGEEGRIGGGRGVGQSQSIEGQTPPGESQTQVQTQTPTVPQKEVVPKNKYGEPDNPDFANKMRMRDIEQADAALEGQLRIPERGEYRRTIKEQHDDAFNNYDKYRTEAYAYDPDSKTTMSTGATIVARAEINALNRKMKDAANSSEETAYMVQMGELARKLHRSPSEAGRLMRLQTEFVQDATDAAATAITLDKFTEGKTSEAAKAKVMAQSEAARLAKESADKKIAQDAATAEPAATATFTQRNTDAEANIPAYKRKGWGSKNVEVTSEQADAARNALLRSFANPSATVPGGIPNFQEVLPNILTLGRYHVEAGAHAYKDWQAAMREETQNRLSAKQYREVYKILDDEGLPQAAATRAKAEERLSTLGADRPPPPKPTLPEIVVAAQEYASGARSLDDFSRRMRVKYENLGDEFLGELFSKAAEQYRKKSSELEHIKRQINSMIQKEVFRTAPAWKKGVLISAEAINVPTALVASFDYSGLLRQGGILAINDPKSGLKSAELMRQAGLRAEVAETINFHIRNVRENAANGNYEKMGIEFTDLPDSEHQGKFTRQEEGFRSILAEKIPVVGKGIKASNRAYATVLNSLRADAADRIYKSLTANGETLTEAEMADIGRAVNIFSGRGDIQSELGKRAADVASYGIFSPRYVTSRFQAMTLQPIGRASSPRMKKAMAKEYANYLSRMSVIVGLGALAMKQTGTEMEFDFRSADFLKMRFGNVEIDPYAGLQQVATFLARMATQKTKTQDGDIRSLREPEGVLSPTTGSVFSRMVRSKSNPIAGTIWNLMSPTKESPGGTDSWDAL